MVSGHGSVNLGRGQINVTQQLLHGTQVGASFEEVGRERVSEGVWKAGHALIENTSDTTRIECTPSHTDEQRASGMHASELRAALAEPPVQCAAGWPPQRNHPLPITFPGDRDEVSGDVCLRERCHLRYAHAGGVQELEKRPVTQRNGIVSVDRFEGGTNRPRWQRVRKRSRRSGGVDPDSRVGASDPPLHTEVEEATDR